MSTPESAAEALRWLRYANQDLRVIERLLSEDPVPAAPACWHAQQAAEKALKAALMLDGVEFPFTHDLNELREVFPEGWDVWSVPADFAGLTASGATSRYPGDWAEPTLDDAVRLGADARTVYEYVVAEFERRGVQVA